MVAETIPREVLALSNLLSRLLRRWQLPVPWIIKGVPISEACIAQGFFGSERRSAGKGATGWQLLAECGAIHPSRRRIEVGKALRDNHGPS